MAPDPRCDRSGQDVDNIIAFEHINVAIRDQRFATLVYVVGMGFTRDANLNVGDENMWANVGSPQFHLPTGAPRVLRGRDRFYP